MRERTRKALAVTPPVVGSAALWLVGLAALPEPVGVIGAGVLAGVIVALWIGRREHATVRVLWGARRLRPDERDDLAGALTVLCRASLGPPLVELRVRRSLSVSAVGVGRQSVIVSRGLIDAVAESRLPPDRAAAVLAHAAAVVRSGVVRRDPLLAVATLPWTALAVVVDVLSRPVRLFPFVVLAWRARVVIVGIAALRAVLDGCLPLAAATAALGAVSYGLPVAQRQWHALVTEIGDAGVAAVGLGPVLGATPATRSTWVTRATRRRLGATAPAQPVLGSVGRRPAS